MMFRRHVTARLARYSDGDLSPADAGAVEAHLADCDRCRQELEDIRFAAHMVRQLGVVRAPSSVWNHVDAALSEPPGALRWSSGSRWAVATALLFVAVVSYVWLWQPSQPWEVATLTDGGGATRMAAGELLETGDQSRARITVGDIGTVDVEAGTRVRLGDAGSGQYRLALERGTISARVIAPPRVFIVDTPTSTVVDLGCAYTVTIGDDGAGELRMTEGWVALEWKGRESLVPAGAMCRTRPAVGPGTPYFEDASDALKRAVDEFDFSGGGNASVDVVLREARVRDTLTLWHLLSRVETDRRGDVFECMASLVPPPANVTREKVLGLDREALQSWREEMAWKW
jgi:hypothetical protein